MNGNWSVALLMGFGPETFLGLFLTYRINPHGGGLDWSTALVIGFALLLVVDVLGALLSRVLRFNFAYLALLSLPMAASPIVFTDDQTPPLQAAVLSLLIYGPETYFGLFLAYWINPHCGSLDYRQIIRQGGFLKSYLLCIVIWLAVAVAVAVIVYWMK